ncbi:hypothetical protein ELH53_23695 [Rhizobium ruizarguesonis]|nr:hypothetical protein ELI39_23620 [Rhizobium ruizarguesonis]TBA82980.1 hypothetical protein ELH56_23225 [Rhizobium ruizarguesonis]TBA87789.1 hypothetical protein ELH53_23695 [Rhizobium ruizarguesonis]TBB78498.1 hypothetical protein ELH43_25260 [Rhizobium ruizarguesonis]TBC32235.1 hypothetical protein ELH35_25120 [Rhizobium ruizarguesonis]
MPYLSVKVGRPRLDSLFSPAGRRWPEGSDEGATRHTIHCPSLALSAFAASPLTSSTACRHLLPAGEKRRVGRALPSLLSQSKACPRKRTA